MRVLTVRKVVIRLTFVASVLSVLFPAAGFASGFRYSCQAIFESQTHLRSQALAQSGVRYLTHVTGLQSALKILKQRSFKSPLTQMKENPARELVTDGDPSYVYLSWTDEPIEAIFPADIYHGKELSNGVWLLLPPSYIDDPSFHHYSNSWKYGLHPEFVASNFADGLKPALQAKAHVEVLFSDRLDFAIEDARLIVSPKIREQVVADLRKVDPSVDWSKVVLKIDDPFANPVAMGFDDFAKLQSEAALRDIYALDPQRALELSREYFRWIESVDHRRELGRTNAFEFYGLVMWVYATGDFKAFIDDVERSYFKRQTREGDVLYRDFVFLAKDVLRGDSRYERLFPNGTRERLIEDIRNWARSIRDPRMHFVREGDFKAFL